MLGAYYRRTKRRMIDRIELMRVRGLIGKYFKDPERWSRYFGYVFLPGSFLMVNCCFFFFKDRIVSEIGNREKREQIYSARKLRIGNGSSTNDEGY